MPRHRVISSAIATCAAARLTASSVTAPAITATESISVFAVGRLSAHAADDAQETLAAPTSSPRSRRLLARAGRQLRFAYVLSIQLDAVDDPASVDAAVCFTAAAGLAADRFARLARRPGHRLERSAVRALRRVARMQSEVAWSVAAVADTDSLAGRGAALRSVLDAQQELVAALEGTVVGGALRTRHRRALRSAATQAEQVHQQLASALTRVRLVDPEGEQPIGQVGRGLPHR